jgi:glycerol-3-phosphate dehydrogenase
VNRSEKLKGLEGEVFDLCIIGGGASGAGCALDASLRGLTVLLIDKGDFASGTSSRSTKLIHGGVRYLETAFKKLDPGQLRQVRHGLAERQILLSNAPHLSHPLPLLTPVHSFLEGLYYRIGLWIYDQFASRTDTLPGSRWISQQESLDQIKGLKKDTHSSIVYYDGQLDDARYCIALIRSAEKEGALAFNYMRLSVFEKDNDGKLQAAQIQDEMSGQVFRIQSKAFLNCSGVWADQVRELANPDLSPRIKPSKGVHLVLDKNLLEKGTALLIPQTPDGRVVFAVPFESASIVGTTDQVYEHPDEEPVLLKKEVDFLLETLNRYLETPIRPEDVRAGFGGLRPLLLPKGGNKTTKNLVRDHEVEVDEVSGLFSLLGGKWTSYRLMAQDAIDVLAAHLGNHAPCNTKSYRLDGAPHAQSESDSGKKITDSESDNSEYLTRRFGSNAGQVLRLIELEPNLGERLHPGLPHVKAEVVYAVLKEMACTPRDVLARRMRVEIEDWSLCFELVPQVAELMAKPMGWTEAQTRQAVVEYRTQLQSWMKTAGLKPN